MSIETQVKAVEDVVQSVLESESGYFLVDIKIKPTNNVKVFIDGDEGIAIEKCAAMNRRIYKIIEENGIFPGNNFSLEVSSPGLDEPLKLLRQYKKNVGRKVEVVLKNGQKKEGKLIEATDSGIALEETRGTPKKPETEVHHFTFEEIKATKIQILFKSQ